MFDGIRLTIQSKTAIRLKGTIRAMSETSCNSLPAEIQEQVHVIDQSKANIILIMASIILSYYTTDLQKQQLICTVKDKEECDCLPKVLPIRMISSIIIISALLFFTNLTGSILEQPAESPKQCRQNKLNHLANQLVLAAAVIRFTLLLDDDTQLEE